jgi:UDP-N-acetylglucosamine 2-epimerase
LDELPTLKERKDVHILHFGKGFAFSGEDIKLLINMLRWSEVVIVFGSTMSLEAVIFDKPVILVAFDGYREQPYQKNLSVALDNTTHYVKLQKTGGMRRVSNEKELIEAIKEYLNKPALHREGRQRMREEFIEPLDGKAGARILAVLKSLVK